MKYRTMRRADWRRAQKRRWIGRVITKDGRRGRESVILIEKATAPLIVGAPDGGSLCVADDGYVWFQRAFEGEETWLTAAFDDKGTILQLYFDVTAGNDFSDPEDPGFRDLYLDVILTPGHGIGVLDRDELDEAFQKGDITREQYERTLREGEKLRAYLEAHSREVAGQVERAFHALKETSHGKK